MSLDINTVTPAVTTSNLTNATFTSVTASASDSISEVHIVSVLGGTQTGVLLHSVDSPFKFIARLPATIKKLSGLLTNGLYSSVPKNTYKLFVQKAVKVTSVQSSVANLTITIDVPAGCTVQDPASLDAMIIYAAEQLKRNGPALCGIVRTGSLV